MFEKQVTLPNGQRTTLRIGWDKKIYLGSKETGYKLGGENDIYTNQGRFASSLPPEEFLRIDGKIK